jgi:hypothetical protein
MGHQLVKKFPAFMEPEGSLPCLQGPAIGPSSEIFSNNSQHAGFLW